MNREKYANDPSYREGYDDGRKEALNTYKNKMEQAKYNINNIIDSTFGDVDEFSTNDEV